MTDYSDFDGRTLNPRYTPLSAKALEKIREMASGEIEYKIWQNGHHYIVPFANKFKASIVKHNGSYGSYNDLFEITVLDEYGRLDYTTPITDDVIGYLSEDRVVEICQRIARLQKGKYYDWDRHYDSDEDNPDDKND